MSDWVVSDPGSEPSRAEVGAEGPDTNPADNVRAVDPRLTLRVANRRRVIVSLRSNQPGTARVRARIAGVSIARTVKFTRAGRRTVRLMPRPRRARQRVISALRSPGRLRARVTASMAGTNTSLRTKL